MPVQKGIFKLKGKLDGVSFFQSEGRHLVRMANGPDKKRILTDRRFERTRENNSEFAGCALAATTFKKTFAPAMNAADGRFASRLISVFKRINLESDGLRGRRGITVSQYSGELNNTEFNVNQSVNSLFTGHINTAHSADRLTATIALENVLLRKVAKPPGGSTHIVFTQMIGVLPDFTFDQVSKRYHAVDANVGNLYFSTSSEPIDLSSRQPVTLTLTTALPGTVVLSPNVSVIQCFSVEYLGQTKTDFFELKEARAAKIVSIF